MLARMLENRVYPRHPTETSGLLATVGEYAMAYLEAERTNGGTAQRRMDWEDATHQRGRWRRTPWGPMQAQGDNLIPGTLLPQGDVACYAASTIHRVTRAGCTNDKRERPDDPSLAGAVVREDSGADTTNTLQKFAPSAAATAC